MKKVLVLFAVIAAAAAMVYADDPMMYGSPEGEWSLMGSRLYQKDADAPRAKAWLLVPQDGSMIYEFTMRYQGGVEDGHGGVGIHILGDAAPKGKSWGMGNSWLLWLNYDVSPEAADVPAGLSAQLYRSTSEKDMDIVKSISLKAIEPLAVEYLSYDIPIKLTYLADKGRVVLADPRGETAGWYVDLPGGRNQTGRYVAVRTNGMEVSFTSPDVNL